MFYLCNVSLVKQSNSHVYSNLLSVTFKVSKVQKTCKPTDIFQKYLTLWYNLFSNMATFYKSYNKDTATYSVSLKKLSKQQVDIICHLLSSLESNGVVLQYQCGFTLPYLEVLAHIPLVSDFRNTLTIPNIQITDLLSKFGNKNFGNKNILLDSKGHTLTNI